MATDFRQIDLDENQKHLLANAADRLGIPWPEVLEKAVGAFADNLSASSRTSGNGAKASPYEILKHRGLIGRIEGTPPDLSTNKKYMEGYGKSG
jgi:hypothetical protein